VAGGAADGVARSGVRMRAGTAGARGGAGLVSRLGREVARAAQVSAFSLFFEFCFQKQQPKNTIFEQIINFFMKNSKHEVVENFKRNIFYVQAFPKF
jgi:hypothetical protein